MNRAIPRPMMNPPTIEAKSSSWSLREAVAGGDVGLLDDLERDRPALQTCGVPLLQRVARAFAPTRSPRAWATLPPPATAAASCLSARSRCASARRYWSSNRAGAESLARLACLTSASLASLDVSIDVSFDVVVARDDEHRGLGDRRSRELGSDDVGAGLQLVGDVAHHGVALNRAAVGLGQRRRGRGEARQARRRGRVQAADREPRLGCVVGGPHDAVRDRQHAQRADYRRDQAPMPTNRAAERGPGVVVIDGGPTSKRARSRSPGLALMPVVSVSSRSIRQTAASLD